MYLTVTICISAASMIAQMITLNMYHIVNPGPVPVCLLKIAHYLGGTCLRRKTQTHPLEEDIPVTDVQYEATEDDTLPTKQHESKLGDDFVREIRKLTGLMAAKNAEDELKDDWRKIARSLDNVFFAVFLTVQVVLIAITLVSIFG